MLALPTLILAIAILSALTISYAMNSVRAVKNTTNFQTNSLAIIEIKACVEEVIYRIRYKQFDTGTLNIPLGDTFCIASVTNYNGDTNIKKIEVEVSLKGNEYKQFRYLNVSAEPYTVSNQPPY